MVKLEELTEKQKDSYFQLRNIIPTGFKGKIGYILKQKEDSYENYLQGTIVWYNHLKGRPNALNPGKIIIQKATKLGLGFILGSMRVVDEKDVEEIID